MSISQQIRQILTDALAPAQLEVVNDSGRHAGHAGDDGSGESHFTIRVVSARFTGKSRLERHRMIYDALKQKMAILPHALAIRAFAPDDKYQ